MKISYILLLCLIAVNAFSLDSNTYRFEKSEVKAILAKKEGNNLLLGIEYKLAKA